MREVPAETAAVTDTLLRQQFTRDGWALIGDYNRRTNTLVEYGFRAKDPSTGDVFGLAWNNANRTLVLTGFTPCAELPQEAIAPFGLSSRFTRSASRNRAGVAPFQQGRPGVNLAGEGLGQAA